MAAGDGAFRTCTVRGRLLDQEVVHQGAVPQDRLGADPGGGGDQVLRGHRGQQPAVPPP